MSIRKARRAARALPRPTLLLARAKQARRRRQLPRLRQGSRPAIRVRSCLSDLLVSFGGFLILIEGCALNHIKDPRTCWDVFNRHEAPKTTTESQHKYVWKVEKALSGLLQGSSTYNVKPLAPKPPKSPAIFKPKP